MIRTRVWRRVDYLLVLVVGLLAGYGVMMVHSASCPYPCERFALTTSMAFRQVLYIAAGVVAMIVTASIHYRTYRTLAYYVYALSLLTLVAIFVIGYGEAQLGVRRWIRLGPIDFQSSELAKVAMVVALARFLTDREGPLSFRRALASILVLLLPLALVFLQPDLGTSLSFVCIWFGMLVMAGARPLHLGLMMLSGVLAAPASWLVLREYQRARIATFFQTLIDPEADPFGEGYNIIQARISIGSGGMFGRGWLEGTQTQLAYLRVSQSDFIFSVLAEEMGFVGALVMFGLFVVLLFRIIRVADKAPDDFGRLVAFGIGCMILFQVIANLGANLTLLPVTGVPLPLMSFGGSAMLTFFIAFGILQSILIHRDRYRY